MSKRSIVDQVLVTLHKRAVAEQVREAKLDARERERKLDTIRRAVSRELDRQEVRDRGIPMQPASRRAVGVAR